MNESFADTIPDLEEQMGITSLEYLDVAVRQSEYYGYEKMAAWFKYWKERLIRAIEEEWNVDDAQINTDGEDE